MLILIDPPRLSALSGSAAFVRVAAMLISYSEPKLGRVQIACGEGRCLPPPQPPIPQTYEINVVPDESDRFQQLHGKIGDLELSMAHPSVMTSTPAAVLKKYPTVERNCIPSICQEEELPSCIKPTHQ